MAGHTSGPPHTAGQGIHRAGVPGWGCPLSGGGALARDLLWALSSGVRARDIGGSRVVVPEPRGPPGTSSRGAVARGLLFLWVSAHDADRGRETPQHADPQGTNPRRRSDAGTQTATTGRPKRRRATTQGTSHAKAERTQEVPSAVGRGRKRPRETPPAGAIGKDPKAEPERGHRGERRENPHSNPRQHPRPPATDPARPNPKERSSEADHQRAQERSKERS